MQGKPPYLGKVDTIKEKADNSDIRMAIVKAVPKATAQTKEIAKYFKGRTQEETCRKIFDFLKNKVRYKADGAEQIIQLPSAILRPNAVADCKSYSLFTAGILSNLGIPYNFVLTSYNDNPVPGHIYVETKDGCIIDAVWGHFNSEKPAKFKYKIPMNVRYLSGMTGLGSTSVLPSPSKYANDCSCKGGMGCCCGGCSKGMTGLFDKLSLKKVTLSIPRQIMLGLFSLNVDGMASQAQKNLGKALDGWKKMGGDPAALSAAIRDGAGKSPKNLGLKTKIKDAIQKRLDQYKKSKGLAGTTINISEQEVVNMLMDGGTISRQYETGLTALGTTIGGTIGALIGGVGAAPGATAGAGIGQLLYGMTPTFVGIVYPLLGGTQVTTQAGTSAQGKTAAEQLAIDKMREQEAANQKKKSLFIGAALVGAALLLIKK